MSRGSVLRHDFPAKFYGEKMVRGTGFEPVAPDVAPFLLRLVPQITGGFTPKVSAHIADLAARMKHEEERSNQPQN
jgi:hypothetical protein